MKIISYLSGKNFNTPQEIQSLGIERKTRKIFIDEKS